MGTHTAGLSEDFGRRVRNLIDSEEYREVFPKHQRWLTIRKLLVSGAQALAVSIMLLVLAVLLLVVVLICSLLTILIPNRT